MSHSKLCSLLNFFGITEVYFGCDGFRIYTPEELEKAQVGYSRHPDGTDLTGEAEGDWKREWVVIGYDTNLGDPYFVDTSSEQLPVYTAMHGMGAWQPNSVSPGTESFLSSLKYLRVQSTQDDSLIEPTSSTITDRRQLKSLEREMSSLNAGHEFWGSFFERHVEWLEENDR